MVSKHMEESHARIFENNRNWVASMTAEDPEFFSKLALGQSPEYLYDPTPIAI
jgi:carbonic anhydrase